MNGKSWLAVVVALTMFSQNALGGAEATILRGHSTRIVALCFTPLGLWSADEDGAILGWPLSRNGRGLLASDQVVIRAADGEAVSSMSTNATGTRVGIAFDSGAVEVRDVDSHDVTSRTELQEGQPAVFLAFSSDDQTLTVKSSDSLWHLVDLRTGQATVLSIPQDANMARLVASATGRYLAGPNVRGTLDVWDSKTGEQVCSLPVSEDFEASLLQFSPDNRLVAGSDKSMPSTITFWSPANEQLVQPFSLGGTGELTNLEFSADGDKLAAMHDDGTTSVVDLNTKRIEQFASTQTGSPIVAIQGNLIARPGPHNTIEVQSLAYTVAHAVHEQAGIATVPVYYATNRTIGGSSVPFASRFWRFFTTSIGISLVVVAMIGLIVVVAFAIGRAWSIPTSVLGYLVAAAVLLVAVGLLDARYNPRGSVGPGSEYGVDIGDLRYGLAKVSIPPNHRIGHLESPPSFWIFSVPADPAAHIMLIESTESESAEAFFCDLSKTVGESTSQDILLFVHGYNVTFHDATRTTAQLAVDLGFQGIPACFDWASYGDLWRYPHDATNAERSIPHLVTFLQQLAQRCGASRIHLVAHSMGNRVLARALPQLPAELVKPESTVFREVVLAAPDIDREVFNGQIGPSLTGKGHHVTLYASSNDRALQSSRWANGKPRAGDSDPPLKLCTGIDVIDASALDTSLMGHSYFSDQRSVVEDMYYLLKDGRPPQDRFGFRPAKSENGVAYWIFVP